jgi:prephenate dehydratase
MTPPPKRKAKPADTIAFQGEPGAYSHLACTAVYPDMTPLPCATFEGALAAVQTGKAALGMIPIENSVAGRVADIHHLMPHSGLFIIAEHFQPVRHCLLGPKGSTLKTIKYVHSHVQALDQNRPLILEMGLQPVVESDTAGSAKIIAARNDQAHAAIASELAAELNGLKVLRTASSTTTRFLILSRKMKKPPFGRDRVITTFVFSVRNVPAALYKALGGFATNGVNMLKLESYMEGGSFASTQFYTDIEGHPEDRMVKLAFEELAFFTASMNILGVYPAHPFRDQHRK